MPALPPTSELTTALVREPAGVRLMLSGELDMNGVLDTERAVEAAAVLVPEGRLTIDLSELQFMDLFGARALLRVAGEAITASREVQIANPRGHVRRLFELITDLARGRTLVSELVRADD
jgi:anti-anti-sigma factor